MSDELKWNETEKDIRNQRMYLSRAINKLNEYLPLRKIGKELGMKSVNTVHYYALMTRGVKKWKTK